MLYYYVKYKFVIFSRLKKKLFLVNTMSNLYRLTSAHSLKV